ncbi:MAG: hydrogenase formation protein HypD [Candidatus Omnitrophica bacterium]|nr:hydrogenase formation protein HypD [Candidatus Omnitrophota bacterium]
MKYIDEFRNNEIVKRLSGAIHERVKGMRPVNIMEVCGTHTMSICKFGIRELLPAGVKLSSGPGCPVCVTPKSYIDKAIAFCDISGITVATFGDMMKVPGSSCRLADLTARGKVRVVYSCMDAAEMAEKNPDRKIIFLGVGFETTTPTVAATVAYAKKRNLKNFFVYAGHKIILPAMTALCNDRQVNISGFLCPAHVSAIIGTRPYDVIAKKYNIPCVITGFEPTDILQGILMILNQVASKMPKVENQYKRVVRNAGNKKALTLMNEVFASEDSEWRGIGILPKSGLILNKRYASFDAEKVFNLPKVMTRPDKGCICGSVLKGIKAPPECGLFAKKCTPDTPVGACMVSGEGTCAAYYRYRR